MVDFTARTSLVQALRQENVVIVAGSGVSIQATGSHRNATWSGLLESGIRYCRAFGNPSLGSDWETASLNMLRSTPSEGWPDIASMIARELEAPNGGEFHAWLESTVGALELKNSEIIRSIWRLCQASGAVLATTNYDTLIEKNTGLHSVPWSDLNFARDLIRRRRRDGVLHIHGVWNKPETVVLDNISYERLTKNETANALQRAIAVMNTLVFIGCGDGLKDPNFSVLLRWLNNVLQTSRDRHFVLMRRAEAENFGRQGRLLAVSYGEEYQDLPDFLDALTQDMGSRSEHARHDLQPYDDAVLVPRELIDRELERALAEAFYEYSQWHALLNAANRIYFSFDPTALSSARMSRGSVVLSGTAEQFWQTAIDQACLKGARMLAALLTAARDNAINPELLRMIAAALARLRELGRGAENQKPRSGP